MRQTAEQMGAHLLTFARGRAGALGRIWQRIQVDDCVDLAAQMSYFFSLSLLPFCLVLAVIVGWLPSTALWQSFAKWIVTYLPRQSQHLIFATILGLVHHSTGFLSLGLATAVWTASSGFVSLMESLSAVYQGQDSRSYLRKHAIATIVTLLAMAFAMATFGVMAFGHWGSGWYWADFGQWKISGPAFIAVRWGVTAVVMGLAVDLAYFFLPDGKRPWHWITPGTVFAVIMLAASTEGFNIYVEHFSSYPRIYGAIGGFMLLMVWIYIICLILLIGAETDRVIGDSKRTAQL
ncbi:MAG TPA: YihY/virulence factor BrkB family protein [Candidatus Aquilonibacter sp.]|nr:YihY/virulence factor BrkB family protein [Candidatus Aquilonibacter sp.]